LSIDEFYVHKEMLDGHLNHCKDCVKGRVSLHREINVERIREYDRKRGKNPDRQPQKTAVTKRRRQEVAGYENSHNAILRAISAGIIQRSNTCQACGIQVKTEAHHFNYELTKTVIWLCPVCHKNYHLGKSSKAEQIRTLVNMMIALKITG
jgi:hypothetical protein